MYMSYSSSTADEATETAVMGGGTGANVGAGGGGGGENRRAFGDGTIYPGTKSCLHSSLLDEIPMKSTLCGLLDELPFQEVADLAHMFNYDDEKVHSRRFSNSPYIQSAQSNPTLIFP